MDAISLAYEARSPGFIRRVLDVVMCGYTQDSEKAFMLKKTLVTITKDYPSIMHEILSDDRMFIDVCEIKVDGG